MKIEIDVPDYSQDSGLHLVWEEGFVILAKQEQSLLLLQANSAGLISLARHLLMLASNEVPIGAHVHLDDLNSLEDGSCELVLEKTT